MERPQLHQPAQMARPSDSARTPSFAHLATPQASGSHLPASLGIGTGKPPAKSLNERLRFSKHQPGSSQTPRSVSNDGLHFPDASRHGRSMSEFGSFPSISTWAPQTQSDSTTPSNPPARLPTSSSAGSLGSTSTSTSTSNSTTSRNFLVPIGATGARQKLSIASASQRRRLAVSDDPKWSATLSSPHSSEAQSQHHHHQQQQQPLTNGHTLSRSHSDHASLAPAAGSTAPSMNRSSSLAVLPNKPAHHTVNASSISPPPSSTPAELVQQAALQRLSSQRILPAAKSRSTSENNLAAPSLADRASSPAARQMRPSHSQDSANSTPERRHEPVSTPSDAAAASSSTQATHVAVPDRTSSNTASKPAATASDQPRHQVTPSSVFGDASSDHSITSKPLTLAESYKRAMIERDAERAKTSPRTAAPRHHPAIPASSSASAAPFLDLDLPSSSFTFDDPASASQVSPKHQPPTAAQPRNGDTTGRASASPAQDAPSLDDERSTRRSATLAHSTPPRAASDLPSLQQSFEDAMAIQDRIRLAQQDEPAYGGLFDGDSSPFSPSQRDQAYLARSYLALRDDEDDGAALRGRHLSPKIAATESPRLEQPQKPIVIPPAAPASPRTPAADRSFVQFNTPEDEAVTPKTELDSYNLTPSRSAAQSTNALTAQRVEQEQPRPSIPRESSLQTLRSPPNKLEAQPGPREEAALRAGATAAATTSPRVSISEADTSITSDTGSQAANGVNGDRAMLAANDELSDGSRWRRGQDALAAFSPAQQSRFSEASTDLSDSRAPTRNENRFSGRASSISSEDGLEEDSSEGHLLPTSAWQEVENALRRFRDRAAGAPADRGNLLRAILLPFLALEAETATVDTVGPGPYSKGKARRALFFDWIRSLLLELQHVQTSADRGAILESIACIIESRNFSALILSSDPEDEARFSSVFGHILSYAIGELNKKGVYQNTLIFSGRLLAVAFFRINGVASKLLRALPVNRFALERVAREFDWQAKRPTDFARFVNRFPATLRQLCYKDSRDYLKMLDSESIGNGPNGADSPSPEGDRFLVCQPEVEVEMSGNWLRRWQSDDSELFFSFCRSYHRQLASLFASSKSLESVSKYFFGGPGYAHLATCVHQKCLALVHRVILSVTTLSSQKNFNPAGETANVLSGSTAGKPRILEAANRRCTTIVVDIVRAPAGSNMMFAPMLGLHIKALIKRTSLYDVQGVFCLLDWLDGVISHMDSNDLINEGLVDISFIITTIGMLLENADHALALMRTIAFCYANFGVLTSTTENRIYFCELILLKPSVFHKLFLSWSFTIRAYYLHLLVFRLARIRDFPTPGDDAHGRTVVRVVRLFNQRLEALRKRHNSLSPEADSSSDDNKSEDSKSRKSGTSTFVSTIKRASTDGGASSEGSLEGRPKAEKIMGMTAVDPSAAAAASKEAKKSSHSKTKTKNWLKAFRGGSSKQEVKQESSRGVKSPRSVGVFSPTTGKIVAPESDDDSKTIGSTRTTPRTSFESASSDAMSDVSTLAGSVRGGRSSKNGSGAFEFDIKQQTAPSQQQQSQSQSQPPQPQQQQPGSTASTTGHDAGIAKDTVFDLQSTHAHHPPTPGRTPQSPRISKAFSRRASMLPGPASELVASMLEGADDEVPPVPDLPSDQLGLGLSGMGASGLEVYDETLHIYAVQSLREYEQTVQEHDEFFASLPEDQSTQVPRLPVNWPAMWSSTGE